MRRSVGLLLMLVWAVGCYASQPVTQTAIPAGTQLQVQLNDAGRVALGNTMGQSVDIIEGRLVSRDSAGWTLAVSSIQLLRGGQQVWSGEHIRIRSEHVALAQERKFSRSRTAIASAVVLGVIVAVAKSSLSTSPQGDAGTRTPGDTAAQVRLPRP